MERIKPLIIAQAPARGEQHPFAGESGSRLAELLGVVADGVYTGDVLPGFFNIHNIMEFYPGALRGSSDREFDMVYGRRAGLFTLSWLADQPPNYVLLVGRKVRRCMGVNGHWDWLEKFPLDHHTGICFPHPSRSNRWWNSAVNKTRARLTLREVVWNGPPSPQR